jgi:hypothetical protein
MSIGIVQCCNFTIIVTLIIIRRGFHRCLWSVLTIQSVIFGALFGITKCPVRLNYFTESRCVSGTGTIRMVHLS